MTSRRFPKKESVTPKATHPIRRLENRNITELGSRLVEEAEKRIAQACPNIDEEQAYALLEYSIAYANSFSASKGKLPGIKTLEQLGGYSLEKIQKITSELPANITTEFMMTQAAREAPNHPHLKRVFGENMRLYFEMPQQENPKDSKLKREIKKALESKGYRVDFEKGTASRDDGKNNIKIGRLLKKLDHEYLLENFAKMRSGDSDKLMMVVSRDPHDIARASTARHWPSCMNEHGVNKHYIKNDIDHGSVAAYLIHASDPDITRPLARRLIKPYIGVGGTAMFPDNNYGVRNEAFGKAAYAFCAEYFNRGLEGDFHLHKNLYPDGIGAFHIESDGSIKALEGDATRRIPEHMRQGQCTAQELLAYLGYQLEQDENGKLFVNSDVDLSNMGFTQLPDFKNIIIKGNFDCTSNQLMSLKGASQKVGGGFYCSNNKLTTLEGGPQEVEGGFYCSNNKLTTLEGGPQEVGGEYNCSFNQLMSLKGASQKVGGNFNCRDNKLTTLEGGPQEVGGSYDCSNNPLENIEGVPLKIGGRFYCTDHTLFQSALDMGMKTRVAEDKSHDM